MWDTFKNMVRGMLGYEVDDEEEALLHKSKATSWNKSPSTFDRAEVSLHVFLFMILNFEFMCHTPNKFSI